MAKTGRKPKPSALKRLEGNPGKRPLNELEPIPPVIGLTCPKHLLRKRKRNGSAWPPY